jgi:hypothetical protein
MWKKVAVVASAAVIAGTMMVYAQQRGDGPGEFGGPGRFGWPGGHMGPGYMGRGDMGRGDMGPGHMGGHFGEHFGMMGGWHPGPDDMKAFADARIAALHAGLELNADQEKTWPAFEQALRDFAKIRIDAFAARDQQPSDNPIERLQKRADAMSTRGAALKRVADAAAPLYQSLDDAQKHRFTILARMMRPHAGRFGLWRERFGGPGLRDGDRDDPHRFGDDRGMHDPHGMGRMHGGDGGGGDDEDYRGPL